MLNRCCAGVHELPRETKLKCHPQGGSLEFGIRQRVWHSSPGTAPYHLLDITLLDVICELRYCTELLFPGTVNSDSDPRSVNADLHM